MVNTTRRQFLTAAATIAGLALPPPPLGYAVERYVPIHYGDGTIRYERVHERKTVATWQGVTRWAVKLMGY